MDSITITLAQVSQSAQAIRKHNQELTQQLMEMRHIMNEIANSWQSPASQTIRTKFNGMAPLFENYRDIIENYAQFLDHTVTSYEATEHAIQQNAASFS